MTDGLLAKEFSIIAIGRREMSDDEFREAMPNALETSGHRQLLGAGHRDGVLRRWSRWRRYSVGERGALESVAGRAS